MLNCEQLLDSSSWVLEQELRQLQLQELMALGREVQRSSTERHAV